MQEVKRKPVKIGNSFGFIVPKKYCDLDPDLEYLLTIAQPHEKGKKGV